ncbi:MAG: GTPase Era [Methylococcales bacterium]|nr:GTPase Era [Methylococcales bacterium]
MKAGYVALIGRPNVGKSTLLNQLLGQKLSITSRKPQTTRHRILGINTLPKGQIVYLDTPGMHEESQRALNRQLNRTADSALLGVDAIVFLIDKPAWADYDRVILEKLKQAALPTLLAINKVDQITDKSLLLSFLAEANATFPFAELIPISALKSTNTQALEHALLQLLPENEPIYPPDQLTDRPERFFCAEMIREKLIRYLGDELPYRMTVEIESFAETEAVTRIHALIWVEQPSQKSIVIGKRGEKLKRVGTEARLDIERMLERKVFLKLWVKVKKGWSDDQRALHSLGFNEL